MIDSRAQQYSLAPVRQKKKKESKPYVQYNFRLPVNTVLLNNNCRPIHILEGCGNRSRPALAGAKAGREGDSVCFLSQNGMLLDSFQLLMGEAERDCIYWLISLLHIFLLPRTFSGLEIRNTFLLHTKLLPHTHFFFFFFLLWNHNCCQKRLLEEHMLSWPEQSKG